MVTSRISQSLHPPIKRPLHVAASDWLRQIGRGGWLGGREGGRKRKSILGIVLMEIRSIRGINAGKDGNFIIWQ